MIGDKVFKKLSEKSNQIVKKWNGKLIEVPYTNEEKINSTKRK